MLGKRLMIYSLLMVLSTLFLGIAYARVSKDYLVEGSATAQGSNSIEIINIDYKEDNNADLNNSNIILKNKSMLKNKVVLSPIDYSSYLTYTVTVKNNTDKDLYYIETVKNNDFYNTDNGRVNEYIVYEIININKYDKIDKNGGELNFDIKFKYDLQDETSIDEEYSILNAYLNFRFRERFTMSYNDIINHDYPLYVYANDEVTIDLNEDAPKDVEVLGDCTYEYIDNILTIKNIKSNIVVNNKDDITSIYLTSGNLNIGSNVDVEKYNQSKTDNSVYFKYNVDNNGKVLSLNVCKESSTNSDEICINAVDSSKYIDNKNKMLRYFNLTEEDYSTLCEDSTDMFGSSEFTCSNDYVTIGVDSEGGIMIINKETSKSCVVNPTFGNYSCN